MSSREKKIELPKETGEALRRDVDILIRKSEEKKDLTEEEDRLILLDIFIHLALIDEESKFKALVDIGEM